MLYLVTCALNDKQPNLKELGEIDKSEIYKVAKFHSLTVITAVALEKLGETLDNEWISEKEKAIRRSILSEVEYKRIVDFMEKNEIWYMPLKGKILQELYPQKWMRQMADIDILFDVEYQKQVCFYMKSIGYEVKSFGIGNHDIYMKSPIYNYEMHTSLYDDNHEKCFLEYYRDVKKKLHKVDENKFEYWFSWEDFYVYLISHMYKHYSASGIGVRSLVDCYVFLKKYETMLNWEYIKQELSKLNMVDFESMIRQVSKKVFSGSLDLTVQEKKVLEECLLSGTYGTMKQRIERQMGKLQGNRSVYGTKFQYIWKRLFPERKILEIYCPLLKKYRCLWLYAGGKRLFLNMRLSGKTILHELCYLWKMN